MRRMVESRVLLAVLALSFLGVGTAHAQSDNVIYVNLNNTAAYTDGQSWATAVRTIRQGIRRAVLKGGADVWVAEGEYIEVVYLESDVHLYAGFVGTETAQDERDYAAHPVIINGVSANSGSPAETVVYGADNSTLDGFVVRGGRGANGGGMINEAASPRVANCRFIDNQATQYGGAMLNNPNSYPIIENCEFTANAAGVSGGAIANNGAVPEISGCTFTLNSAGTAGGAMVNTPGSSALVEGCLFEQNTAGTAGGAVYTQQSSPSFSACRFLENASNGQAGGVFNDSGTPFYINCLFVRNTAEDNGGAITNYQSEATIINCTITENDGGPDGGALFNNDCDPKVVNCILWRNDPEEIRDVNSNPDIRYSDVYTGYDGTGNININPRFVDPDNDDYGLLPYSRCINTGTAGAAPVTDLAGTARPQGTGFDMGCYEATEIGDPEPIVCGFFSAKRASGRLNAGLAFPILVPVGWWARRRKKTH